MEVMNITESKNEDYQGIDLDLGTLNTLSTYEWIGEIEREIQDN